MNLYQFIEKDQGGNLWFDLPRIADPGTITARIYSNTGSDLGLAAITEYLTSSSLQSDSLQGKDYVTPTSVTGFKVGQSVILTDSTKSKEVSEVVQIKAISTPPHKLTLQRPILSARVAGDVVGQSRIKVAISAAQAAVIGRNYAVKVNYEVLGEEQEAITWSFTVSRYLPVSNIDLVFLSSLDPTLYKKAPSTFDFNKLKDVCWSMLLQRLSANYDPGGLVGTINFTIPHAYLMLMVVYESAGSDYEQQRLVMADRFEKEFISACASAAYDEKQTGKTTDPIVRKVVLVRV